MVLISYCYCWLCWVIICKIGAGQSVKAALDEIKGSIAAGKKSGAKGMAARTNLFNNAAKDFHGNITQSAIIIIKQLYNVNCMDVH
jgi:hypothetical protein